jgi:hypothetical protein
MIFYLHRNFFLQSFPKAFFASGKAQSAASSASAQTETKAEAPKTKERKERVDIPLSQREPADLKQEFQKSIASLDSDHADKVLEALLEKKAVTEKDLLQYQSVLSATKNVSAEKKIILPFLEDLGKTLPMPSAALLQRRAETLQNSVQRDLGMLPPELAQSKNALLNHTSQLIRACTLSNQIQKGLNNLYELDEIYTKKSAISVHDFLNRWKTISSQLQSVYQQTASLDPDYASIPFLLANIVEHRIENLKELAQFSTFLGYCELLEKLETQDIKTIGDLEHRLARDLNMSSSDMHLTPGAIFDVKGKKYKIKSIEGNKIIMNPRQNFTPAELYFSLLLQSHGGKESEGTLDMPKSVEAKYIPAFSSISELEKALGFSKTQKLEANVEFNVKEGYKPMVIEKINPVKKEIQVIHSRRKAKVDGQETWRWTRQVMDYQQFYLFCTNEKTPYFYAGKNSVHTLAESPTTSMKGMKKKNIRLMSLAAVKEGFKWIKDSITRMGKERTEVDASNFSYKIAKVLEHVPWLKGIENISMTGNNDLVLGIINKYVEQYSKGVGSGEFDAQFQKFFEHNKIQQAALLHVAAKKGMSKKEIFYKLGGDKNISPTHEEYVAQVINYFCKGPDAIPGKFESHLTANIGKGVSEEIDTGFNETKDMLLPDEILDTHRFNAGRDRPQPWKRFRSAGSLAALLKLGSCSDQELGIAVMWTFKLVKDKNFNDDAIRKIGNMGKTTVPILGLFRVPTGMAKALSLINFFEKHVGNPYVQDSDEEKLLGMVFIGKLNAVEKPLKQKMGEENYKIFKDLYEKTRMYAYGITAGADFAYQVPSVQGADLDDNILAMYGVGGVLSEKWMDTILTTETDGTPKHAHDKITGNWWDQLEKDEEWQKVSLDERKLFAYNFSKAFNALPPNAKTWYINNRRKALEKIFSHLVVTPPNTLDYSNPGEFQISDRILQDTSNSIQSRTIRQYAKGDLSQIVENYNVNVQQEAEKNIEESIRSVQQTDKQQEDDIRITADDIHKKVGVTLNEDFGA